MSLQVIKDLELRVKGLTDQILADKEARDVELKSVKEDFTAQLAERKTEFDEPAYSEKAVETARTKGADMYLQSVLMGKDVTAMAGYKEVAEVIEKSIVPTDLPAWLAEEFSNSVIEDLTLDLKVESLFVKINMPENRNQFSIPAIVGDVTAYLIAPGDDAIESAINSAKVTFETKRIKTLVGVTDQADQETVVMLTDIVKQRLVKSLAKASEDAIINGDITTANPNDVRKAFDGLLTLAIAAGNVVDGGGVAPTAQTIAEAREALGIHGVNVGELAIISNFMSVYKLLLLPEVITIDKYGPQATILTGEIGKIWGIPIIVSEYVGNDLDAGGAPGGNTTALLLVNTGYFGVADRGSVTVETERRAVSSTNLYVGFRDFDFKVLSTTATPVAALTNLV